MHNSAALPWGLSLSRLGALVFIRKVPLGSEGRLEISFHGIFLRAVSIHAMRVEIAFQHLGLGVVSSDARDYADMASPCFGRTSGCTLWLWPTSATFVRKVPLGSRRSTGDFLSQDTPANGVDTLRACRDLFPELRSEEVSNDAPDFATMASPCLGRTSDCTLWHWPTSAALASAIPLERGSVWPGLSHRLLHSLVHTQSAAMTFSEFPCGWISRSAPVLRFFSVRSVDASWPLLLVALSFFFVQC